MAIDVRCFGDRILAPTPTESPLAAHYHMIYSLNPKNAKGKSGCGSVPYSRALRAARMTSGAKAFVERLDCRRQTS